MISGNKVQLSTMPDRHDILDLNARVQIKKINYLSMKSDYEIQTRFQVERIDSTEYFIQKIATYWHVIKLQEARLFLVM